MSKMSALILGLIQDTNLSWIVQMRDDLVILEKMWNCIVWEVTYHQPNSIDLCFTSPPYFNTERYA